MQKREDELLKQLSKSERIFEAQLASLVDKRKAAEEQMNKLINMDVRQFGILATNKLEEQFVSETSQLEEVRL